MKWLTSLLPKRLIHMTTPDPAWESLQKVLNEADAAAKARISMAMLNSAAIRVIVDLDNLQVNQMELAENKDGSVSVLFCKATDLGFVMWALGHSGTMLRIFLSGRYSDRLVYDVDFQSHPMVLTAHLKPRTQLITKLTLSEEAP